MKGKFLKTNFIQRNPSQLTPWQAQNSPVNVDANDKTLEPVDQQLTMTKRFLPRMIKYHEKSATKLQKMQYRLARNSIVPDEKTFDTIRTAKQTSFNGFITKYKTDNKKKTSRYLIYNNNDLEGHSKMDFPNTVKFINYTSFQHDAQSSRSFQNTQQFSPQSYHSRQFQLSRKRSLSNLIKSIGKDKYLKLKEPCKYSPWMLTNCLSYQRNEDIQRSRESPQKTQRSIKLIQLNLGIRQKNLTGNRNKKGVNK